VALCERESERARLAALVDGVGERGGALVVRGEAGIGKSALLAEIRAGGLRVLTATGVAAEQHLTFAGLHQLLFPLRKSFDGLPAAQGEALRTALGLADGPRPEIYLVGMAVLNLLAEAAADRPVLLVVDDAHWLDAASQDVLTFVARRLESEPIAFVAAIRDGEASRLDTAGLPTLNLAPLSAEASLELLGEVAPALDSAAKSRVVAAAAGNPLALRELSRGDVGGLELTFAARVRVLPAATRTVLLVAALNDSSALSDALCAANADLVALTPAVEAGLIVVGSDTLTFRHPLMRSAVVKDAAPSARQAAHKALAGAIDEPDRRAWHRASAATGPDETVARELEQSAQRAEHRGGVHAAVASFERAAQLSESAELRAVRLLKAASLAVETGRRELVDRLLADASRLDLTENQRAVVSWLPTSFDDGLRDGLSGPGELADLAVSVLADDRLDLAMGILWGAAMRCFWVEPGPADRRRLIRAADRMPLDRHDPRLVAINAYVTPFERGESVLADLAVLAGQVRDPQVDRFLGSAAMQVGAFDLSARFSAAAQPGLRTQGRLAFLARAVGVQAWSCVRLGDLATALSAAEEGERLAVETAQPYIHGLSVAVQAEIAALRGDYPRSEELCVAAERIGLAAGARPVLATVQLARGIAALGEGRHADAFANLMRLNDSADPAYQMALRCYVIAELTEAAVRCDQLGPLEELLREFEIYAARTPSPALHIGLRHARAVLAPDDEAEKLFRAALDADPWPLERGRIHLAFGEWLRRQRRPADSRPQLRAARETFEALGVTAWAERARNELRAAGEASPDQAADAVGELTPHELTIARLAASGLTNREIGQQLYLSHRTVSTHLHRIFPKLGISSRGELRDVLGG
jgi:DNA-binding CsgD family transcriptional regulator